MHHLERYTSPEWRSGPPVHHTTAEVPLMPLGHESVPGTLCIQNVLAMLAIAPQIGRATLGRATPLAHPNAPSRALYGPGVARPHPQPQKHSTCVLPTRPKAAWDSFARKRCSQRQHLLDNARSSRRRTRTARAHPNALSRALDGPGVARPRTQPQKRHARVLSTCRDESRDPFALKRCVLKTCCTSKLLAERPTSRPPKSFILSVTRVVSGASTHTCLTETLRMLTLAPPKRLPGPLCTQKVLTPYGTSESARISWTSEQPLAHQNAAYHIERCTGPELRAHAHARRNAPHACFGHAKSVPRALCSHIWCSQWHLS